MRPRTIPLFLAFPITAHPLIRVRNSDVVRTWERHHAPAVSHEAPTVRVVALV